MSQESHINAAFGGLGYAERKAFPENDETFKERVERAKEKVKNIFDSVDMVILAKNVLRDHKDIDIFHPNKEDEERLTTLCDKFGYDPAVVTSLCQELEERIRNSH